MDSTNLVGSLPPAFVAEIRAPIQDELRDVAAMALWPNDEKPRMGGRSSARYRSILTSLCQQIRHRSLLGPFVGQTNTLLT